MNRDPVRAAQRGAHFSASPKRFRDDRAPWQLEKGRRRISATGSRRTAALFGFAEKVLE
jgi:hypothetical protein